jgi:hypothetical protein
VITKLRVKLTLTHTISIFPESLKDNLIQINFVFMNVRDIPIDLPHVAMVKRILSIVSVITPLDLPDG